MKKALISIVVCCLIFNLFFDQTGYCHNYKNTALGRPLVSSKILEGTIFYRGPSDANPYMRVEASYLNMMTELKVTFRYDRPGILNGILKAIDIASDFNVNVTSMWSSKNADNSWSVYLTLDSAKEEYLTEILARLKKMPDQFNEWRDIHEANNSALKISIANKPGALSKITELFFEAGINIRFFIVPGQDKARSETIFEIGIPAHLDLQKFLSAINEADAMINATTDRHSIFSVLIDYIYNFLAKGAIKMDDRWLIGRAFQAVLKNNISQIKQDGISPVFMRPIKIIEILCREIGAKDVDIIIAAILHDNIKDISLKTDRLNEIFQGHPNITKVVTLLARDTAEDEVSYLNRVAGSQIPLSISRLAWALKIAEGIYDLRTLGFNEDFDRRIFFSFLDTFILEFTDRIEMSSDGYLREALDLFKKELLDTGRKRGLLSDDNRIVQEQFSQYSPRQIRGRPLSVEQYQDIINRLHHEEAFRLNKKYPSATFISSSVPLLAVAVPASKVQKDKMASLNLLSQTLSRSFDVINMNEDDLENIHALSGQMYREDSIDRFVNDSDFREEVLYCVRIPFADNMAQIWDLADTLNLTRSQLDRLIEDVYSNLLDSLTLVLPDGRQIKNISFGKDIISDSILHLNLCEPLDENLKGLIRKKLPKDLQSAAECNFRGMRLDEKGLNFLISLIERNDCSTDMFRDALSFVIQKSNTKNPDFHAVLENERDLCQKVIEAHRSYNEIMRDNKDKTQAGGSSIDWERDVIQGGLKPPVGNPREALKTIILIDYILGLDWDAIPVLFDDSLFEIGTKIAPRSKRIRNIKDYIEMYFSIFPMRENKRKAVEMSLVVMNKLYMFLNEYGKLLKELNSRLGSDKSSFEADILDVRLAGISSVRKKIIDSFEKVQVLQMGLQYIEALKRASDLFMDLDFSLSDSTYPTLLNREFTSILFRRAKEPALQEILLRLNEIDFDSCRLIEFMNAIAGEHSEYSTLRFPYMHNFNDIIGFDMEEDPWGSFKGAFKDIEGIDISGIRRIHPLDPARMELIVFGDTVQVLITELLKNAIAYAHFDPKKKTLTGEIKEGFWKDAIGYHYYIEDNNEGIPPDKLESIFYVCESKGTGYKKFAGGGVGLAEVRNIVDMYGGKIKVISKTAGNRAYELEYQDGEFSEVMISSAKPLGHPTGTRFIITLPYTVIDMQKVVAPESQRGDLNELPLDVFDFNSGLDDLDQRLKGAVLIESSI